MDDSDRKKGPDSSPREAFAPIRPGAGGSSWLARPQTPSGLAAGGDLDRALVAGLLLEVILDDPMPHADPRTHRRQVKSRLKDTLVSRLAGRIPLDSFRHLAQKLDLWFDTYYPLITPSPKGQLPAAIPVCNTPTAAGGVLLEADVAAFLDSLGGLLPQRPHRKLSRERLLDFLRRTGAHWFRLRDFQEFFGLDRKTAWEYVRNLAAAGLFCRNDGRSAAVRYRLEARFIAAPGGRV